MNRSFFFSGVALVLIGIIVSMFGGNIGAILIAAIGIALASGAWRNPSRH